MPYRDSLDIDLHSCIHFLLDMYNQLMWNKSTAPPLVAAAAHSLILLSDLFFEKSQYVWMLDSFFHHYKHAVQQEDEVQIQLLVLGIIKCCAVLNVDPESPNFEKLKKCVENGLKSQHLASRVNTIRGFKDYLICSKELLSKGKDGSCLMSLMTEYLVKQLSDQWCSCNCSMQHMCLMWDLSFALIEHHVDDFSDCEFGQKMFHLAVAYLASDNKCCEVRTCISAGLERLMLVETFAIREADLIVRTAMDRMRSFEPNDESPAFRLMVTAIHVFGLSIGSEAGMDSKETEAGEDIAAAMEKTAVIFDRLKFCGPDEAARLVSVLPALLVDFFPEQDVLNKVIAEFLSNQQLYPQLLAQLVFDVSLFFVHDHVIDVLFESGIWADEQWVRGRISGTGVGAAVAVHVHAAGTGVTGRVVGHLFPAERCDDSGRGVDAQSVRVHSGALRSGLRHGAAGDVDGRTRVRTLPDSRVGKRTGVTCAADHQLRTIKVAPQRCL